MSALATLGWRTVQEIDTLPAAVDCPRGRITEVIGARSTGRTSLLHSVLAASTGRGEFAAVIDTNDAFDPSSAAGAGVQLEKLIWVRCAGNVEHAMRAADLVIHAGGFGVVAVDLAEASDAGLRRIPATTWFRWRRAVESTPTVLMMIARAPVAKSCPALIVEMRRRKAVFEGNLLRSAEYEIGRRKPLCMHASILTTPR
jgi:recombination protein RecA